MNTIEIWPDRVEGGDAIGDGVAAAYPLFTDTRTGCEVAVMIDGKAETHLLAQLDGWIRSRLAGRDQVN